MPVYIFATITYHLWSIINKSWLAWCWCLTNLKQRRSGNYQICRRHRICKFLRPIGRKDLLPWPIWSKRILTKNTRREPSQKRSGVCTKRKKYNKHFFLGVELLTNLKACCASYLVLDLPIMSTNIQSILWPRRSWFMQADFRTLFYKETLASLSPHTQLHYHPITSECPIIHSEPNNASFEFLSHNYPSSFHLPQ